MENLDPKLHANVAIELAATGEDRDSAVRHARRAPEQIPGLMSASTAALPETISVLLFADHAAEAREAAGTWLDLAQQHGSEPAVATAAGPGHATELPPDNSPIPAPGLSRLPSWQPSGEAAAAARRDRCGKCGGCR